jgi:hypothetical protein
VLDMRCSLGSRIEVLSQPDPSNLKRQHVKHLSAYLCLAPSVVR